MVAEANGCRQMLIVVVGGDSNNDAVRGGGSVYAGFGQIFPLAELG
jgi:hypothetical protein